MHKTDPTCRHNEALVEKCSAHNTLAVLQWLRPVFVFSVFFVFLVFFKSFRVLVFKDLGVFFVFEGFQKNLEGCGLEVVAQGLKIHVSQRV